jgi:hypothetical protein
MALEKGATMAGQVRLAVDQFIDRWKAGKGQGPQNGKTEDE